VTKIGHNGQDDLVFVIHLFVLFVYEHAGDGDAVSSVLHGGYGGVEEHGGGDDDNDVFRESRDAHDHTRGVTNQQEDRKDV
jgi:hypothetical protein